MIRIMVLTLALLIQFYALFSSQDVFMWVVGMLLWGIIIYDDVNN
jgi:VIT1/CCC1 family predicted Fe2+/Mn2+ transporter